jgi:hypothetical protein
LTPLPPSTPNVITATRREVDHLDGALLALEAKTTMDIILGLGVTINHPYRTAQSWSSSPICLPEHLPLMLMTCLLFDWETLNALPHGIEYPFRERVYVWSFPRVIAPAFTPLGAVFTPPSAEQMSSWCTVQPLLSFLFNVVYVVHC